VSRFSLFSVAIPLYYALPIWAFFAIVGVSSSMVDANALSAKHGGLAFASMFFGFLSLQGIENRRSSLTPWTPDP
jgi:hypothetical protein